MILELAWDFASFKGVPRRMEQTKSDSTPGVLSFELQVQDPCVAHFLGKDVSSGEQQCENIMIAQNFLAFKCVSFSGLCSDNKYSAISLGQL